MASLETVMGATLVCSLGGATSKLRVIPIPIFVEGFNAGTIIDGVGMVNIPSFGSCAVIESCVPATTVWTPGNPTVLMDGIPALAQLSICHCAVGGIVSIVNPNNFTVFV